MENVNLLLPISGESQRFMDAGYIEPKPMIKVLGRSIIEWSMNSVNTENINLIFVVRKEHIEKFKIDVFLKEKFDNVTIVVSETVTEGAVSTCLLAEEYINNDIPLAIFTPDCYFVPKIEIKNIKEELDGLVAIFPSDNPMHSYAVVDVGGYVTQTAEKKVISKNAVAGFYYFKHGHNFVEYAKEMIKRNLRVNNEFYICPIYNLLIENGLKIGILNNSKHYILGRPDFLKKFERSYKLDRSSFVHRRVPSISGMGWVAARTVYRKKLLEKTLTPGFICAEVGVWNGSYSDQILEYNPKKFYMIDYWLSSELSGDMTYFLEKGGEHTQSEFEEMYKTVKEKYEKYENVEVIRKHSLFAARQFENEYFDWIYLDASHYYDAYIQDLKAWLPKVKKGGYLTGDNYEVFEPHKYGTIEGVHDLFGFVEPTHEKMNMNTEFGCLSYWHIGNQLVIRKEE